MHNSRRTGTGSSDEPRLRFLLGLGDDLQFVNPILLQVVNVSRAGADPGQNIPHTRDTLVSHQEKTKLPRISELTVGAMENVRTRERPAHDSLDDLMQTIQT